MEKLMIMSFSSSKSDKKYQFRSISLPSRSHPTTLLVEDELNNLKTWENSSSLSSESICSGLFALEKLYDCVDDLLNSKSTYEALAARLQNHQRIDDELFNGSLQLLDVCNSTRENMFMVKQHVQGIQSALRRRTSSPESVISDYISFRKKMKKDAKKLIISLNHLEHRFDQAASPFQDQENHHLSSLIRILTEVSIASISVFESLLLYLSFTFSSKRTRWSLVSRVMNKKQACQDESFNDFANADAAASTIFKCNNNNNPDEGSYLEKMQTAHKILNVLESSIEDIENGLENMFRRLVKTRASLLNIISQ